MTSKPNDVQVSVIIPAKNAARWVVEQLDALAQQVGAPPFEVVIGDNGSSDGTREAAVSTAVPFPVQVVDAAGPASASHARNVAASAARGEILLFCDADDLVDPRWVGALVAAVKDDPGLVAAGSLHHERFNPRHVLEAYGIGPDAMPAAEQRPTRTDAPSAGFAGYLPTVAGGNFAVHRQAYLALGGMDPSYPGGSEETDFAWRAQEAGHRVLGVPQAVVHYRLKHDARSLFRQQRIQQRGRMYLWMRYRHRGMNGPSVKASVSEILQGLRAWPRHSRDEASRLKLAYQIGAHVGALEGMFRYRLPWGALRRGGR